MMAAEKNVIRWTVKIANKPHIRSVYMYTTNYIISMYTGMSRIAIEMKNITKNKPRIVTFIYILNKICTKQTVAEKKPQNKIGDAKLLLAKK